MSRWLATALLALAVAATAGIASTMAASTTATTVVTAEVLSATNLDVPTGCAAATTDVTDFGQLVPGSSNVTGGDCTVTFGSSNDTSMLRLTQQDGAGIAMHAWDEAGSLDPGYGTAGVASMTGDADDGATGIDIQPSGLAIVAGHYDHRGTGNADAAVWRLLDDGSLDPTFGTGVGETRFDIGGLTAAVARDVHVEPDGTLTVAGYAYSGPSTSDGFIARLDADGQFIGSFGTGGIVQHNTVPYESYNRIEPHPDGGWVVAGYAKTASATDEHLLVARLLEDGSLDTGFDGNGYFMWDFGTEAGGFGSESVRDIGLLSDGRIVATGYVGSYWITFAVRPDGQLDTTGWNSPNGYWQSPISGARVAGHGLVVRSDDTVVTAGVDRTLGTSRFTAIRHLPDGTLDPAFGGGDGMANDGFGGVWWEDTRDVIELHDGRLLLAGTVDTASTGGPREYALEILSETGAPTTQLWGGDGQVIHEGVAGNETPEELHLGPDGHVMIVGFTAGTGPTVMRLDAEQLADYDAGTTDWTQAGVGHFGVCLRALAGGGAGAGAGWAVDGDNDCTASDADPWRAVARTAADATGTLATSSTVGATATTVDLRFGLRVAPSQAAGSYSAPTTFEAVAPDV